MNTLEIERVCNGWLLTERFDRLDANGAYADHRMHVATSRVQVSALVDAWLMPSCETVPVGRVPE